jgi:predicted aldo/keto reductase-like oxidoreductase
MSHHENHRVSRRGFLQKGTKATAGLAVGVAAGRSVEARAEDQTAIKKTRSYNPEMEYRRLGKTNLWISAVALGGHWKRIDKILGGSPKMSDPNNEFTKKFHQNRHDVISRCIDVGINLLDTAGGAEPDAYAKALKGRRDKMYFAWMETNRNPDHRTAKQLVTALEKHLLKTGMEYADIWRVMCLERGGRHTRKDVAEMISAFQTAKQRGLCRFTGLSTHDHKWMKMLIEKYPEDVQVLLFPYTAKSKKLPKNSFFTALKTCDVGVLGIKPFASNSLFMGDGDPKNSNVGEDNKRARMAIRYVLANPAITAPIPGLASVAHVDNMALAVKERREMSALPETELNQAADEMWARLPDEYQWLKKWEYV